MHPRTRSPRCKRLDVSASSGYTDGKLDLSRKVLSKVPTELWSDIGNFIGQSTVKDERNNDGIDIYPIKELDLSVNLLISLPSQLSSLHNLTTLDLHNNCLTTLPKSLSQIKMLEKLNVSNNNIKKIPKELFVLNELKYLNLSHNQIDVLHPDITNLVMLENLDISNNQLCSLPNGIGYLVRLKKLAMQFNELKTLPEDIGNLRSLTSLNIMKNNIERLPDSIEELRWLEFLNAQNNNIKELPCLMQCKNLKEIYMSCNKIKSIPTDFSEGLYSLEVLHLNNNEIDVIPDEVSKLQKLTLLDVSKNMIQSLPYTLADLPNLTHLAVAENPIKSIRRDVLQSGTRRILKTLKDQSPNIHESSDGAIADTTTTTPLPSRFDLRRTGYLLMSGKNLKNIPGDVFLMAGNENVSKVDISKNKLFDFPCGLLNIQESLNELILAQNLIKSIPPSISNLSYLLKLNLSQNLVSDLPDEFGLLDSLTYLDVSFNRLKFIPKCIYKLKFVETLLLHDNKIEAIDEAALQSGSFRKVIILDLANNDIKYVPPVLGNLPNIRAIYLAGNLFRNPSQRILEKGTEEIISYLKSRI